MNKYITEAVELLNESFIKPNISDEEWAKRAKQYLISRYQLTPLDSETESKLKARRSLRDIFNPNEYLFSGNIVVDGHQYVVVGTRGINTDTCTTMLTNVKVLSKRDFYGSDARLDFILQHEIGHQRNDETLNKSSGLYLPAQLEMKDVNFAQYVNLLKNEFPMLKKIPNEALSRMISYSPTYQATVRSLGLLKGKIPNFLMSDSQKARNANMHIANELARKYEHGHAMTDEAEADMHAETHGSPQYRKILNDRGTSLTKKFLKNAYSSYGVYLTDDGKIVADPKKVDPEVILLVGNEKVGWQEASPYKAANGEYNKFLTDLTLKTYYDTVKGFCDDIEYRLEASKKLNPKVYEEMTPRKFNRKYPQPEDKTSTERKARQELIAKKSVEQAKRNEEKQSQREDLANRIKNK